MYIHIYVEKTGLNRLKSKMRFHCKNFKPNVNHRVLRSRRGCNEKQRPVNDKFFHRATRDHDETRQAFSENTRKFTRDYEKSDGIILTRVTSWRPRLIASREILSPLGMRRSYARKIYYGRI